MLTLDFAPIARLLSQPSLSATQQAAIAQAIGDSAYQYRCSRRQAAQRLHEAALAVAPAA